MNVQLDLFDDDPADKPCPVCGSAAPSKALAVQGKARTSDPDTAHQAARLIAARNPTAKVRLLEAFRYAYPEGLTDEEAAMWARLPLVSEYATRCSELRQLPDPLLEVIPGETRTGAAGVERLVSRITRHGIYVLEQREKRTP